LVYYDSNKNSGLLAVRVIVRVWDLKSRQSRQITIVQDL
jgi:hypothetical protein